MSPHPITVKEMRLTRQYYHPLRYFTVKRPMGIEYFGEIEIEEGKCIHGESNAQT